MWKNHLLIAYRNLRADKTNTGIHAVGLGLGIGCALVMFLLLRHELTFDRTHTDRDRIYRINEHIQRNGYVQYGSATPYQLAEKFRTYMGGKESGLLISQIHGAKAMDLSYFDEKGEPINIFQPFVLFADPQFLQMFDFGMEGGLLLQGQKEGQLSQTHTALLTEKMAAQYFHGRSAIGQTLLMENGEELLVTGIVKNPPANSSIPFTMIVSFETFRHLYAGIFKDHWNAMTWAGEVYVKLPEGTSPAQLDSWLSGFVAGNLPEDLAAQVTYLSQPLTAMHTDTRFDNGNYYVAPAPVLWAFFLLGLFSLGVACVNFVNLATAQAFKRAKEIGIRKVLGSSRGQVIRQFLIETALLTALALAIGLVLGQMGLDQVNQFLAIIQYNLHIDASVVVFSVATLLLVPLIAGSYPAYLLSGFNPAKAIKHKIQAGTNSGASWLRKGLIMGQFAFSQFLIIGTLVVAFQMAFVRSADLGFVKEHIVKIPLGSDRSQAETFRQRLLQQPDVVAASLIESAPTDNFNSWSEVFLSRNSSQQTMARVNIGAPSYLETFGIKLIAGENKLKDMEDDGAMHNLLINETLAKSLGYTQANEIVGEEITFYGSWKGVVVGVMKDFHNVSLKEPIRPALLFSFSPRHSTLAVRYRGFQDQATIATLENHYREFFPDKPFKYAFLEETIKELYVVEDLLFNAFKIFSIIAILIGCLGLYGLIAFMVARKSQEIGVRKVLGASVSSILGIFTLEFFKLMALSYALAAPLAFFALQAWLSDFSYRITLSPLFFVAGLVISALVTVGTVGMRSWKAATANPVDALKDE